VGYSVVTTVLSAAASYDLTDLATAKDELSIATADTSHDTWLGRAITQVSKAIATHTKRVFAPEYVQDVFDVQQDPYPYQTPGGFAQLELTRWPVLAVVSVVQTLAPGTTQTLVEGTDFRTDPATGRLLRLNLFTGVGTTWEAVPVTVTYSAGFGALVQEPHTVPASAPYTVTVADAGTFSCAQSVSYASGTALTLVAASPAQGQYSVADGVYTFNAGDEGQSLTFVYATLGIPEDLIEIVLRLITARYWAKDRDPALVQQDTPGVGTQRWWFGGAPGQKGPFPPDVEAFLDSYRMPVVA
jgi:hypothetical protein